MLTYTYVHHRYPPSPNIDQNFYSLNKKFPKGDSCKAIATQAKNIEFVGPSSHSPRAARAHSPKTEYLTQGETLCHIDPLQNLPKNISAFSNLYNNVAECRGKKNFFAIIPTWSK